MRDLRVIDGFRLRTADVLRIYGSFGDETCGVFVVPSPIDGAPLKVIASSECDWDHVSVSRVNRTPNWPEMARVKELFFRDGETVMQLHVPAADHINDHPFCLHLWRPQKEEIPRPPSFMVGGMSMNEAAQKAREYADEAAV